MRGIHRQSVDSPHRGPVMWQGFHAMMTSSCRVHISWDILCTCRLYDVTTGLSLVSQCCGLISLYNIPLSITLDDVTTWRSKHCSWLIPFIIRVIPMWSNYIANYWYYEWLMCVSGSGVECHPLLFWYNGSGHETAAVLLPGFAINW